MNKLKLIIGVAVLGLMAGAAQAQVQSHTKTVVEPVPYANSDVVRAKFIRPGDVSPEEYQALLDEAARINAYQNQQRLQTQPHSSVSYSNAPYETAPVQGQTYQAQTYQAPTYVTRTYSSNTQMPTTETNFRADTQGYQIELYDTPAPQTSVRTAATSQARSNTHYVVRGDTLFNIAKRNNVSVSALRAANNMSGNDLSQGQTLIVPIIINPSVRYQPIDVAPVTTVVNKNKTRPLKQPRKRLIRNVEPVPHGNIYRVLPKDTVYSISRSACVSVTAMQRLNQINNPSEIQPGQKLQLPAGHCLK